MSAAQHLAERNLRVLQACDALEEHGQTEKPDDESPHSADIMRLDFKLNLLLDLAGQLLAAEPAARAARRRSASTRWARPGKPPRRSRRARTASSRSPCATWSCSREPAGGIVGGAARGETRVRFLGLGETVADHIEKLVFRRHRRKIAGSRQQRG